MKIILQTDRLILRELVPSDLDAVFALDSDPEVHKFIGNRPATSKLDAIQSIEDKIAQYKTHGVGRWAIIDKQSNAFLGWAGLKFICDETNKISNYYDLGYRLHPRFWGQGIATEAAKAILAYGFSELNIDTIYAMAEEEHFASHRVLEKIGMRCLELINFEGKQYKWFALNKLDFL